MSLITPRDLKSIRRPQAGVSIVEALVALLILSFGMLGIAGLYLESLRSNKTALSRTAAVALVNDMADRIRANRGGLGNYALTSGATATTTKQCDTALCTPTEVATWDKATWKTAVTATLPNGPDGTIVPLTSITYTAATATVPARYVVSASWRETGTTDWMSTQVEVMNLGSD
ncbi:MAG TPA: type IV pilus modification protein PilV [Steroidobacteraceae bacterium]|nr:type IV pilus modification protein PilV [Steroidobacteraceae bacterium]